MEDLTVSEDNDHLGTSVRGGQEPSQSLNLAYWKNNKQAALQLRVEGSRRGEREQRNSQHLTHTWMGKRVQKP